MGANRPRQEPVTRRKMMHQSLGWTSVAVGALVLPAWYQGEEAALTPWQAEGPFYPQQMPADHDHDLVKVTGQDAAAMGTVLHLHGRILDRFGAPIDGARVEIWQCDKNGIYHHPDDREEGRDLGFQGIGVRAVDARGGYAFRTIRPTAYSGRTPHIHFKIKVDGKKRLSTQMYDAANKKRNANDGIYTDLSTAQQRAVTVAMTSADSLEAGAVIGEFNLILS